MSGLTVTYWIDFLILPFEVDPLDEEPPPEVCGMAVYVISSGEATNPFAVAVTLILVGLAV